MNRLMTRDIDAAAPKIAELRALVDAHGRTLLTLAAGAIRRRLETGHPEAEIDLAGLAPELAQPGAAFVTLTHGDDLRGCIGSVRAWRALALDVAANALAAAFEEPRFPPLERAELNGLAISASVLSRPEPIPVASEAELLAELRPGIDGLVLRDGERQGVFLPQVWERAGSAAQFVAWLKEKAGLPPGHWSPGTRAFRFETVSVKADDLFG